MSVNRDRKRLTLCGCCFFFSFCSDEYINTNEVNMHAIWNEWNERSNIIGFCQGVCSSFKIRFHQSRMKTQIKLFESTEAEELPQRRDSWFKTSNFHNFNRNHTHGTHSTPYILFTTGIYGRFNIGAANDFGEFYFWTDEFELNFENDGFILLLLWAFKFSVLLFLVLFEFWVHLS